MVPIDILRKLGLYLELHFRLTITVEKNKGSSQNTKTNQQYRYKISNGVFYKKRRKKDVSITLKFHVSEALFWIYYQDRTKSNI